MLLMAIPALQYLQSGVSSHRVVMPQLNAMSHFISCLNTELLRCLRRDRWFGKYKTVSRERSCHTNPSVRLGYHVMASLLQLISVFQPLLMMLNNSIENPTSLSQNATLLSTTQNVTASSTPLKLPPDFSSLVTFIYSFSALHDYLKIVVLGSALETLRRLSSASYTSLVDRFFLTATFESGDLSFGEQCVPRHLSHY